MSGNHKKFKTLRIVTLQLTVEQMQLSYKLLSQIRLHLILIKDFVINDKSSPWYKKKIFDLFKDAYTPWEWHKEIFQKAKSRGLEFLSTPFHEEAVDFLEKLNVPCYKVASFENNHLPLIKHISQTKKPLIISTGMASFKELQNIHNILKKNKNEYVFLKCTSAYPASAKSFNLYTLKDIQKKFNCIVGLSDHSIGRSCFKCCSFRARVIEKPSQFQELITQLTLFSSDKNSFKILFKISNYLML